MAAYAFEGPKWSDTTITWSFATRTYRADSSTPFSNPIVGAYQSVVGAAFQSWASVAPLNFVQVADPASAAQAPDIRVGFGYLGTLRTDTIGLTDYFSSGGRLDPDVIVRLEDPAELPVVGSGLEARWQGLDSTLYQVAVHEIGHALGLDHSSDPQAVMYPVADVGNRSINIADAAGVQRLYGVRPGLGVAVTDTTQGVSAEMPSAGYAGPVPGLQHQYVDITADNLNVTVKLPNSFVHTGSGADAIDVSAVGGTNVLDGGTNSNFIRGGTGSGSLDTFFVDNRGTASDIWSTVANFHAGDAATVWGVTSQDFALQWLDDQGAPGFTGLTLHALAPGRPTASLTLAGYGTADLSNGRLSTVFGSVDGSSYMLIRGQG